MYYKLKAGTDFENYLDVIKNLNHRDTPTKL